jgi:predicted RNA polymerase sigma factor
VNTDAAVEDLLRDLAPQVLGTLARRHGDFADAEDATQEALIAAATRWPTDGVPVNPRGWLITVASRRLADIWRSEAARHCRETLAGAQHPATTAHVTDVDDSLTLLLLCCHPALPASGAIPLTLRAVGSLTTAEIARAFLIPEPAMAKRITRAKRRIRDAGAAFTMPTPTELPERLRSVLHVLYLMFNEGYAVSSGTAVTRIDLSAEAIRLARMLHTRIPDHEETAGLLALMLLTDARRSARTGPQGELVSLPDQDRTLWNRGLISEGTALITTTLLRHRVGYYQLQAAIAALHDEAPTVDAADWPQILALYDLLTRISTNPMVALNRAVAVAMVHGPVAGLRHVDRLDKQLSENHRVHAVRAHLLQVAGDTQAAIAQYQVAARMTISEAERRYLLTQASRLAPPQEASRSNPP